MQRAKARSAQRRGTCQGGFTLIEVLFATAIVLIGVVAVAQLVPLSLFLNTTNRTDSTALVIAQREMNYLMAQPISSPSFTDPLAIGCPSATTCGLGDVTQPGALIGSPVVTGADGTPLIDFGAPLQPGYSFPAPYVDPNDPTAVSYDIRWAVIISGDGSRVAGKRFVVGVRKLGGNAFHPPITLD